MQELYTKIATALERMLRPNEAFDVQTYPDARLILTRDDEGSPTFSLVNSSLATVTTHYSLDSFVQWISKCVELEYPVEIWCAKESVVTRYDGQAVRPDRDTLWITTTQAWKAVSAIAQHSEAKTFFKPDALWSLLVSKLADAGAGTEELTLQLSEVTLHAKSTAKESTAPVGIKQTSSRSTTMELAFAGGKTELPTTIRFDVQVWNEAPEIRIPINGRLECWVHEKEGLLIGIHIEDLDAALLRASALLQKILVERLPESPVYCGYPELGEIVETIG